MNFNKLKNALDNRVHKYINERIGFKTNKKIVVFESDDWGSIRMPSKEIYNQCLKAGYRVDLNLYERFDSLASKDDLELLFNVLSQFKDSDNNTPILTANSLVSNPDFYRIEATNEYYRESIKKTFNEYPKHNNCLDLWHEGERHRVFKMQYHGNEHIDTTHFINSIRRKDEDALFALKRRMPGIISKSTNKNNFVRATYFNNIEGKTTVLNNLINGLKHFEEINGYKSLSFIAPNYRWDPDYNEHLLKHGVYYFQGKVAQLCPTINRSSEETKIFHYTGEKNNIGQYYMVRNCDFEPTLNRYIDIDNVSSCLMQIKKSFSLKKPAIISSHRVNYVGFIEEKNRDTNLKLLEELLGKIIKLWPDVIFLSSEQLGNYISSIKN